MSSIVLCINLYECCFVRRFFSRILASQRASLGILASSSQIRAVGNLSLNKALAGRGRSTQNRLPPGERNFSCFQSFLSGVSRNHHQDWAQVKLRMFQCFACFWQFHWKRCPTESKISENQCPLEAACHCRSERLWEKRDINDVRLLATERCRCLPMSSKNPEQMAR